MLKPVNVIAPLGSIYNPKFPRACFARFAQAQRAVDLVMRALAPVIPDKICAGTSAHIHFISYSGFVEEENEYWVYLEVDEGSSGGRPDRDGMDSVDILIANTRNNPIEELEWRFPMRTERYELRDEPAAPGEWRGGMGIIRVNRFLEETIVTCEGDRHESDPPWGIFGGHEGLNGAIYKNIGTNTQETWPSKVTGWKLDAGDTIAIVVPSGGGYGDPLDRDPALVVSDILDGFTTHQQAEQDYGVVLDPVTLAVDETATAALRASRR
jgi:5-oxoprolinase (ATP-hydrolysing)